MVATPCALVRLDVDVSVPPPVATVQFTVRLPSVQLPWCFLPGDETERRRTGAPGVLPARVTVWLDVHHMNTVRRWFPDAPNAAHYVADSSGEPSAMGAKLTLLKRPEPRGADHGRAGHVVERIEPVEGRPRHSEPYRRGVRRLAVSDVSPHRLVACAGLIRE